MKSLFLSSNGCQSVESQNKKRSLLFDRVQNDAKISDFRRYIHKNVDIYHTDEHKRTILMFTAENYHLEVFIYLVHNYPKLILHTDDKDMNIMHYIASSNTDDEYMIELITNKKFCYNKLVWMRTKDGFLPKDVAKESHNKRIIKAFESIMRDTWSEYSHIARDNSLHSLFIKEIDTTTPMNDANSISDSDDMDMDQHDDKPQNNDTPSRSISICSRKRTHRALRIENDDAEDCYVPLNISKRRKLNPFTYVRTTPQQATLSPSPLPPLPPIGVSPFSLHQLSDTADSCDVLISNHHMNSHSPISCNSSVSGSTFLSLPCAPSKANRSAARNHNPQHMNGLWYSLPSEIRTMNRNQVFGEFNNGICIGGITSNVEIDRFSDRMRELQLSERMSACNREEDINEDEDVPNALIGNCVINNIHSIHSSDCDVSEDDDL